MYELEHPSSARHHDYVACRERKLLGIGVAAPKQTKTRARAARRCPVCAARDAEMRGHRIGRLQAALRLACMSCLCEYVNLQWRKRTMATLIPACCGSVAHADGGSCEPRGQRSVRRKLGECCTAGTRWLLGGREKNDADRRGDGFLQVEIYSPAFIVLVLNGMY